MISGHVEEEETYGEIRVIKKFGLNSISYVPVYADLMVNEMHRATKKCVIGNAEVLRLGDGSVYCTIKVNNIEYQIVGDMTFCDAAFPEEKPVVRRGDEFLESIVHICQLGWASLEPYKDGLAYKPRPCKPC